MGPKAKGFAIRLPALIAIGFAMWGSITRAHWLGWAVLAMGCYGILMSRWLMELPGLFPLGKTAEKYTPPKYAPWLTKRVFRVIFVVDCVLVVGIGLLHLIAFSRF